MLYSKLPKFQKHKLSESPIYNVSVRIVALNKDCSKVIASGTGVVIAQNLVLTAKHVFLDFIDKLDSHQEDNQLHLNFNIWVIFISSNLNQLYHIYEVSQVYLNPYSDLVLFHLDSFDKAGGTKVWTQAKLSIILPVVGERIVAFGFSKSNVGLIKDELGKIHIEIGDESNVSVGEIIDVFPEKRDSIRMPFPSIQINARIDGGMSGGPVFNDMGELLGIVCSSFDQEELEDHISYVALLWPLMATTLTNKEGECYSLYDLAKNNIIGVSGLENITVSTIGKNSIYSIFYNEDKKCE